MAEYKRKNVKKLKNVKPKKSAVAENFKISSFGDEQSIVDEIELKSAKASKAERRSEKQKAKYLNRKQPEKRVVYSGKTAEELNSVNANIRMLRGTGGVKKVRRIISAVCAALIIAVFVAVQLTSPTGVIDYVRVGLSGKGNGNGFPLNVDGSSVYDIKKIGNCFAVVTDTNIEIYNTASKSVVSEQHSFSSPKISVSETRLLLYDQGSTDIEVYDISGKLYEATAIGNILTASVSRNGYFAVVTEDDKAVAAVTVYNTKADKIGTYKSDTELINAAAVSNNGKFLSVLTVTAVDGKYNCKLLTLNTDGFKTVNTTDVGVLALAVEPLGTASFAVSSAEKSFIYNAEDNALRAVSDSAVQFKTLDPLYGYCNALGVSGTGDSSRLIVVDGKLQTVFDYDVCASPAAVSFGDEYLACAKDYHIYVYDIENGKEVETLNCGLNAEKFIIIKNKIFVVNGTTVTMYEVGEKENELDT